MNVHRSTAAQPMFRRPRLAQLILTAYGVGLAGSALLAPGVASAQASAAPAAPAASAAAATSGVQSVTVTARKRAELMIDVPISMQTLSEKDLRAAAITEVKDLQTQAGFVFTAAQSTGAYGRAAGMVTFRGLQGELGRPNDSSGGIFIDGVLITGGISTLGMSDVSRVEVLKGPQNAFFGRSTFGGAVNFITRNPQSRLKGAVNTMLNQRGSIDADATIEGGLIDNLLTGRITVASHNKRPEYRAADGGDLGAESSKSVSGTLFFTPNENLWLRVRGSLQKNDDSLPGVAYLAAGSNTSCTGKFYTGKGRDGLPVQYTPGTPYFCDSIPTLSQLGGGAINANTVIPAAAFNAFVHNSLNDPFLAKTPSINHAGMRSEVKHLSTQLGYALPGGMDLSVSVGYNESNTTSLFDLDKTGTNNFMNVQVNPTDDLTMDARLSTDASAALRGVIGVSRYTASYGFSQIDFNIGLGAAAPVIGGNYSNFESTVPAVYGSVEYDLTQQLTASLEARYQQDKVESRTRAGVVLTNETKNWLPRFTLRYKLNPATSMYLNLAKGVQPLTVNSGYTAASEAGKALIRALIPGASDFTEQPELTAVELGLKQRVGNNLQYSLAVYDQKWTGRLTGTTLFNPSSCGSTTGTTDCPFTAAGAGVQAGNDARIRGIELSIDAQLSPQWTAGAYFDLKHATWDKFLSSSQSIYGTNRTLALTGAAVDFSGNKVGRVPELTISANTTYRYPLSGGWQGYVRGDISYVGKQWDSDYNFVQSDPYSRLDARVGFEKAETSVELFVRNLGNNRDWTTSSRVPNLGLTPLVSFSRQGMTAVAQEARTYGVRMRYAF